MIAINISLLGGLKREQWQHFTVVMGDENNYRVYLDGLSQPVTVGGYDFRGHAGSDLIIGARGGTGKFFKGSIDDIRIYSRALSEEQVKALYGWEKPKE